MTFQDIFKSSFLENITSISMLDMVIALVLAFLLGLFIFLVYKKSYSGVMYSPSFGVTLIALALITKEVYSSLFIGILTGGLTAAAAGITTSLVCGVVCSLVGRSHDQN